MVTYMTQKVTKNKPNFILYHEFSISEMGNVAGISSQMPHHIVEMFMNAKDKIQ